MSKVVGGIILIELGPWEISYAVASEHLYLRNVKVDGKGFSVQGKRNIKTLSEIFSQVAEHL